jgi:hypothetical protein
MLPGFVGRPDLSGRHSRIVFLATRHSSLATASRQGRRRPESTVRAYLTVIDRNPEAVEKALMNKA